MIVFTFIVAIGLLVGIWLASRWSLRLGGVVVVPLLAVYTFFNVTALPIFVLSTCIAYPGIRFIQDRWLLYGRSLLLTAILLGAIVPVVVFLVLDGVMGQSLAVSEVDFLGSILPGIAAYNFYRQEADRRVADVLASLGLLAVLIVVGVVALVGWERDPCWTCTLFGVAPDTYVTPVLLRMGSDAVDILGLPANPGQPVVGTLLLATLVIVLGLGFAEFTRFRWGLRPAGVIALPLVALFSLRAWWILPLYLVVLALAYAGTQAIHAATLVYGRALLSLAVIIGVVTALPMLVAFDFPYGLSVFFTAFLAGIGAYNFHVVPPRERRATLVVNAGIFAVLFAIARILIAPLPNGLARSVTSVHVAVWVAVILATAWTVYRLERLLPSNRAIHEASPFRREVTEE